MMNIIVPRGVLVGVVKGGSFSAENSFVLLGARTFEMDMTNKQKFVGLRLTRRCSDES